MKVKNAYGQASSFAKVLVRSESSRAQQAGQPTANPGQADEDAPDTGRGRGICPGIE